MTLSKSNKVFLGVLGLAAAAFLADRFLLQSGGPAQARASGGAAAAPAEPARGAARAGTAQAAPSGRPSLADRLAAIAKTPGLEPTRVRDAFAPPEPWLAQLKAPVPVVVEVPKADPCEIFLRDHKLTSMLLTAAGGVALVDGKRVRIGEEVDGFRLVRLEQGSAVFQSAETGKEAALRIQGDRK